MRIATDLAQRSPLVEHYLERIDVHLTRLREGHDPMGHLFAIERLARAARIDWWTAERGSERHGTLP